MNAHSPAWEDFWNEARAVDVLDVATRLGAKLKRSGPDHVGHCPGGCTNNGDGFVVTPKKGIFLCRPSGESGDVVDMVCHVQGCGKVEALEFVTGRDRPAGAREESAEDREKREQRNRGREAANAKRAAEAERAADAKRRADEEAVADVLARAKPIADTHAWAYLNGRGLRPAKRLCGDLRFVGDLDYWGTVDGEEGLRHLATLPAMVAIIRDLGGAIIGIHQTYLDPKEPRKWAPIGAKSNAAKKVRGEQKGGLIRLGMIGEALAIGEGIETTLSWHALGYGPEDVSIACALNKGNMSGGWTGSVPHPRRKNAAGKPTPMPNGIPDVNAPGAILPPDVVDVYMICDGDSETLATQGAMATGGRRWAAQGRRVFLHFPKAGMDFNDLLRHRQRELAA